MKTSLLRVIPTPRSGEIDAVEGGMLAIRRVGAKIHGSVSRFWSTPFRDGSFETRHATRWKNIPVFKNISSSSISSEESRYQKKKPIRYLWKEKPAQIFPIRYFIFHRDPFFRIRLNYSIVETPKYWLQATGRKSGNLEGIATTR